MKHNMPGKLTNKSWRLEHIYWVINRRKDKIKFKPNRAQVHFNENKALRNIILKSRRLGFTTWECIDTLDDCLFTPNFEGLLIAHKQEEAYKIFDRKIHFTWKNLFGNVPTVGSDGGSEDLKNTLWTVDTSRTNELKFQFPGGKDFSSISVSNSGRSGTYNRVHISEFAKLCKKFPQTAVEVITGTIPAVPPDGRVDIESTAEGEEGQFYEMFMEAWEKGEPNFPTEYKAHFYNWTWDDEEMDLITDEQVSQFILSSDYVQYFPDLHGSFKEYQEKNALTNKQVTYYYTKWLSLNRKFYRLFQEYPLTVEEAFATSGNKLFDRNAINRQKEFEVEGEKVGNWTYYENYKPGHTYALGADVGHGVGRDSSTIVIMDFTPLKPKVVADYSSNEIDAAVFAHEVLAGGTRYGNCLAGVENNDRGYATNVELSKIYSNIYQQKVEGKFEEMVRKEYGWRTTGATKPKMMLELKTAYNDDLMVVPSKRINREAKSYDEDDLNQIRFDEEQTKHWDLLIALAICWQMRTSLVYESDGGFSKDNKKEYL